MDCTFDTPKAYDGSTPTNTLEIFQFSHATCILPTATPTPSGAPVSTNSATLSYVDIASNSAMAVGVHGIAFQMWISSALMLIVAFFFLGTYMFKK